MTQKESKHVTLKIAFYVTQLLCFLLRHCVLYVYISVKSKR